MTNKSKLFVQNQQLILNMSYSYLGGVGRGGRVGLQGGHVGVVPLLGLGGGGAVVDRGDDLGPH